MNRWPGFCGNRHSLRGGRRDGGNGCDTFAKAQARNKNKKRQEEKQESGRGDLGEWGEMIIFVGINGGVSAVAMIKYQSTNSH